MKRALLILMLTALAALAAGCAPASTDPASPAVQSSDAAAAEVLANTVATDGLPPFEIKEKLFIAQVNDIYLNADNYMDRLIEYEGVFDSYPYNDAGDMFYSVIRYGPGCCGDDGNVGFEVIWDKPYPENGEWLRVSGRLERYEEYGETYLRLRLSDLTRPAVRGNETVAQ